MKSEERIVKNTKKKKPLTRLFYLEASPSASKVAARRSPARFFGSLSALLASQKRSPIVFARSPGFELGDKGFADPCLTTWLWRLITTRTYYYVRVFWSGLRGSNPPPRPWQGRALPNELNPHLRQRTCRWCLRSESNQRHEDFQSSALPTELQRHSRNGDSDGARTHDLRRDRAAL